MPPSRKLYFPDKARWACWRRDLAASKFRPYRQAYAVVVVLRLLTFYCIVMPMLGIGRGQLEYSRRWAELQADRLAVVCRSGFFLGSAYASLRYVDDR